MKYKMFYAELGKLLYAAANIDGTITGKEKEALEQIVREELATEEEQKDEFGTNVAHYAEFEFDVQEETGDSETAFRSFGDFVDTHQKDMDEKARNTCLRVVRELSAAYRGTNKKEKELLEALETKLWNTGMKSN